MITHNFLLSNCDTDSVMFCKPDGVEFSIEEQEDLLKELNSLFPKRIHFEHDGLFSRVLVLKAKNYVLWDGKKLKIKGSALKASTKEKALKELIKEIIDSLLNERSDLLEIYHRYIKECMNVKDITRWASRKTITEAVMNPERTNEQKVADALEGEEFQAGDRVYTYFKSDGSLELVKNFNGDYDQYKLMEKVYKTFQIFDSVIDLQDFIKYHLKTRRKFLEELKFEYIIGINESI